MRVTVKQARVGIDATMAEMAEKMGVCLDTYRKFENEPGKMTVNQALKFARLTGITLHDIFFPDDLN